MYLDRLIGCTLAEDIKDENGNVVASTGTLVTKDVLETVTSNI